MNDAKRALIGSPLNDLFKQKRKELRRDLYMTDLDMVLVNKTPPGNVALIDVKKLTERLTFSQVISYSDFMQHYNVYIIWVYDFRNGVFSIDQFLGGDFRPDPPIANLQLVTKTTSWQEYEAWEIKIRREWANLKTS